MQTQSITFPDISSYYQANYKRFVKKMFFRSGTHEDAEDIVQEAFTRALRYAPKARIEHFGKWFSLVLTNALRDHMNASKGYSQEEADPEEESVDCSGYSGRVMKEIYELIGTKSEVQQEVLNMHIFDEYSVKAISDTTSYTYDQVYKIITRFRTELKTLYKE